jgi:hypothetical protein
VYELKKGNKKSTRRTFRRRKEDNSGRAAGRSFLAAYQGWSHRRTEGVRGMSEGEERKEKTEKGGGRTNLAEGTIQRIS